MNKLLEKLKKQATKEVWGNNEYNGSPEFEGYELDAEKFAKLIIKECIAQCNQVTIEYDEYQGIDGELAARAIGAYNCSDRISDYFEVEK